MCAVRTSNSNRYTPPPLSFFCCCLVFKLNFLVQLYIEDGEQRNAACPWRFINIYYVKNRLWETWYNCIINCYLSLNDTITKEPPSQIKKRLVIRRCLQLGRKSPVTCFFVLILCLSRRWALLGLIIGALSDVYCRLYTYIFRVAYIYEAAGHDKTTKSRLITTTALVWRWQLAAKFLFLSFFFRKNI